jgi:NADPH-dependent ferric siderophore reductase
VHLPGQDLMFAIVADRREPLWRRYTVRDANPAAATVDVDALIHGDGPGASWMAAAQPGDHVRAVGPRGNVTVRDGVAWHLFIGDASFVPAAAMLESLPADSPAFALLEVVDGREHQLLDTPAHLTGSIATAIPPATNVRFCTR